ncbi:MAG: hypothetical protein BGO49_21985 [Planctomycetales bacterium 71-10]|nr:MAG: hypothetical protein BGO49_21985 [Planctomycetales bacterium 71-10]
MCLWILADRDEVGGAIMTAFPPGGGRWPGGPDEGDDVPDGRRDPEPVGRASEVPRAPVLRVPLI